MLGFLKAVPGVISVGKKVWSLKSYLKEARELKVSIEDAAQTTKEAAADRKFTDEEFAKIGQKWVKVCQEGNDLEPILARLWKLIT